MHQSIRQQSIGILGFGNMGRAIFDLLKKQPSFSKSMKFYINSLGINRVSGAICVQEKEDLFERCDLVFLCVKPQEFYKMSFVHRAGKNQPLLISIMAGVNIKNIKKITGCQKLIRAMPNLPLQIGKGYTGWHANKKYFSKKELDLTENIFSCFGKSLFVSQEEKLDAVTAISGSGPAYVFLFANALVKSAMSLGFSRAQAEEMTVETIRGSVDYLISLGGNTSLDNLINKVRSKKGTTEAALNELNINNFYKKWNSAVKKAHLRAKVISSYEIK